MPHTPEQNKAIVREFYDLAFNQRQPEAAVAKHVGGMYRQHNPMAGDGPGPFISFVRWFTGENPQMRVDFKRFIADGDLVACVVRRWTRSSRRSRQMWIGSGRRA
jgi:predicted SnoaL-like aldol condensation-catalyzing enzyme